MCLIAAGALVFISSIDWGLPSARTDAFLFSNRSQWPGPQVLLEAGYSNTRDGHAADVSSNPVDRRERAVIVNATDRERARIVRRYRLMSYQPDEFATFAALSAMKPGRGDLDPRMYKYGGLWIYPVGGLLKLASAVGLVRLTPDPAYYLDHPQAFGRFYIVARLYSAVWGLVGIVAVFLLVERICGSATAATCAALCFMLMPVVVTAAHEAKPHLAGMTLALCAVLASARYVEGGSSWRALIAAVFCGAAVGMVPSELPAVLILPMMLALRKALHSEIEGRAPGGAASFEGQKETGAAPRSARGMGRFLNAQLLGEMGVLFLIALLVYCVANPYVPINLLRDRAVLRSDLGNSSDFYDASIFGLPRAVLLIGLGASFVLAIVGMIGAVALGIRAAKVRSTAPQEIRRRATGLLLAAATLPVGIVFVVFAAGQPADYARFALPFDVFLAIEAVVAVETFIHQLPLRLACYTLLVATTGFMGVQYVIGFERDTRPQTSRTIAAARLSELINASGQGVLASREEPAPWSLPPVDLFRWTIVLPPRGWPVDRPFGGAMVTVGPKDTSQHPTLFDLLLSTPISWADKPFRIQLANSKGVAP